MWGIRIKWKGWGIFRVLGEGKPLREEVFIQVYIIWEPRMVRFIRAFRKNYWKLYWFIYDE